MVILKRLLILSVITLTGCPWIKPGNVVDPVDPNNCAVRAVHIEGNASALGVGNARMDGTQVSFMNMKACPGLQLTLPSPRDSSRVIGIVVPPNDLGGAVTGVLKLNE